MNWAIPPAPGDFGQLLQLADNLIGNAIRYGCSETSPTIEVSVSADGARVNLVVSDKGDGIAPEHLPRLTERSIELIRRAARIGGTGLGLAIVKHIVERHRGTLDIRSTPGQGTTVSVSLPTA